MHDQLLNEVLAADVEQTDLILFNILAREQAEILLASADDHDRRLQAGYVGVALQDADGTLSLVYAKQAKEAAR